MGSKHTSKHVSLWKGDTSRIFHSWKIYISFAVGLLLILHPLFNAPGAWTHYSPMMLLSFPLATSDFTPFAALFCVLPFADSFCEDYNSNYVNSIVLRTGTRKYARQRCFSTAISGGIIMSAIMFITILFCILAAGQPDTPESVSFLGNSIWMKMGIVLLWNGALLYICRVLFAFLFGALWALTGLAISTAITNRYVTLIAPFVLYQVLWFFLNEKAINPVYLLRCDSNFIPSFGFALTFQLLCIVLCAVISYLGIRKKVRV